MSVLRRIKAWWNEHVYLSTACLHGQHDKCRKHCPAECYCACRRAVLDEGGGRSPRALAARALEAEHENELLRQYYGVPERTDGLRSYG